MLVVVTELFLVMGLTWVAEVNMSVQYICTVDNRLLLQVVSTVISWRRGEAYSGPEILVFDVINSLQGLLIFLVLICKPRMRVKIRAAILDLAKSCTRAKQQDNTMVRILQNHHKAQTLHFIIPSGCLHCVSQDQNIPGDPVLCPDPHSRRSQGGNGEGGTLYQEAGGPALEERLCV